MPGNEGGARGEGRAESEGGQWSSINDFSWRLVSAGRAVFLSYFHSFFLVVDGLPLLLFELALELLLGLLAAQLLLLRRPVRLTAEPKAAPFLGLHRVEARNHHAVVAHIPILGGVIAGDGAHLFAPVLLLLVLLVLNEAVLPAERGPWPLVPRHLRPVLGLLLLRLLRRPTLLNCLLLRWAGLGRPPSPFRKHRARLECKPGCH
mmetsp:Transcript_13857/g.39233  ORF Transcript_13857/g.39233 Transcript_13857/m.39233 type:complete len:205 (-) Transcript_13857:758-1372(-)